jgi:hypothetical protein
MFISRQNLAVWSGDPEFEMDFLSGELFGIVK